MNYIRSLSSYLFLQSMKKLNEPLEINFSYGYDYD